MPIKKAIWLIAGLLGLASFQKPVSDYRFDISVHHTGKVRWPNFYGQKNLLNLEINYGSEKAKREPTQV